MIDPTTIPQGVLSTEIEGRRLRAATLELLLDEEATLLVFLRHLG